MGQLGSCIELNHPSFVECSLQTLEGSKCRGCEIEPVQEHSLVVGKEVEVVFEGHQVELGELRISRVRVHDIELAADECRISEGMLQAANVRHLEPVASR